MHIPTNGAYNSEIMARNPTGATDSQTYLLGTVSPTGKSCIAIETKREWQW